MSAVGQHPEQDSRQREAQLVIEFLKDRDVNCYGCGYNLRNLTSGKCPECDAPIGLRVGERDINLWWFALAVWPGILCSALTALTLLVAVLSLHVNGSMVIAVLIGVLSGAVAFGLLSTANTFIRRPLMEQAGIAVLIWIVHAFVLLMFIFVAP